MLSRVAERVYWSARYLERISSTVRLVSIYQSLLFDLPNNVSLSWYNLIIINDLEEAFGERYTNRTERNVVKFLLGDEDNPSSLINSMRAVRENVRTTRDAVPEEAWEMICELSMYVQDNIELALNRRSRHEFLEDVTKGCLQINGLLFSTMPQDAAWEFLHIGRNLERADMTSRYLEAGLTAIIELKNDDSAINSRQIIWGSVLRSLNASQYYLRATRSPVIGEEVVPYLLNDTVFPKSIAHCIGAIIGSCAKLPRSQTALKKLKDIQKQLGAEINHQDLDSKLLEHFNQLQILLTNIHIIISDTWFPAHE
ncbi:MAG: alpha-E domain-containing protein [Gammaproteobacteria bacterium]|uniref:alpha-E domain-containing protein n=1 Tax=Pseudomaricurvus alcaniphilus TaxID=1166482 RepID=UPI0014078091|nr:alpha-E domain-containing protein [Pseudomaricurvus alcaniphilus]MBR9909579.1 alpha-E domain-containing protein [Gammaproteobacteria bacterium]NHN37005.1 alpha-E domain-containing protein [Pseudomaricurvus alcaniphilus]